MSLIKSSEEIEKLREGGKRLASVLAKVSKKVSPGVTALELDTEARELIRRGGDEPSFLNYTPEGAGRPFPATLCVSVNDEVVHGIPNEGKKVLQEGNIVGLDIGLIHQGTFVDMAVTLPVGEIGSKERKLLEVTKKALGVEISACQVGGRVNDIGCACEKFAKPYGYGIVEDLGGHGVGHAVHEPPHIPNYCLKGKSLFLKPGMVLALEPMLNLGSKDVLLDEDGHTFRTKDGSKSAHFEHTILISAAGPEILTAL